jgi:hypothetical protein
MGVSLFAYPSDNEILQSATLSMTNADTDYPAANGNDADPGKPLKATTTGTVITITFTGDKALKAVALINTSNLTGATITLANPAGLSQAITYPARTGDGQAVHPWIDLRSVANATDDVWTITISGAAADVAIGEIVAVTSLRQLNWRWGGTSGPDLSFKWPTIRHKTFAGSKLVYRRGTRQRSARGVCERETDRASLLILHQMSQHPSYANDQGEIPFLFIPDAAVNDAWYVALDEDEMRWIRQMQNRSETAIAFTEVNCGPTL